MKIFKSYYQQFLKILLPIFIFSGAVCFFLPKVLNLLLVLNYFFFIPLLFMVLLPRTVKPERTPVAHTLKFFIKISGLQFIIVVISFAVNSVFTQLLPFPPSLDNHLIATIYQTTLKSDLLYWGLFPWSLITLSSLALILFQKKYAFPITPLECVRPVIKKQYHGILAVGITIFLRLGLTLSIVLIIGSIGLSVYYYLSKLIFGAVHYGTTILFLIILISLFSLINSIAWKKILKKFWKNRYSSTQLLLMQTFIFIVFSLFLTWLLLLFAKLAQINIEESLSIPLPNIDWLLNWKLFNWIFWLGVVGYLAPIIAKMGAKVSSRVFIRVNLFWPLLAAIIFILSPQYFLGLLANFNHLGFIYAVNILCCFGLSIYFWKSHHFDDLLITYLYREAGIKQKSYPLKLFQDITLWLAMIILLYLFSGLKLLMILFFTLIATNFVIYSVVSLAILKLSFKER